MADELNLTTEDYDAMRRKLYDAYQKAASLYDKNKGKIGVSTEVSIFCASTLAAIGANATAFFEADRLYKESKDNVPFKFGQK